MRGACKKAGPSWALLLQRSWRGLHLRAGAAWAIPVTVGERWETDWRGERVPPGRQRLPPPAELPLHPEERASCAVRVTNHTHEPRELRIRVAGEASAWAWVAPLPSRCLPAVMVWSKLCSALRGRPASGRTSVSGIEVTTMTSDECPSWPEARCRSRRLSATSSRPEPTGLYAPLGFRFADQKGCEPVRFYPCEPVQHVINDELAPPGGVDEGPTRPAATSPTGRLTTTCRPPRSQRRSD